MYSTCTYTSLKELVESEFYLDFILDTTQSHLSKLEFSYVMLEIKKAQNLHCFYFSFSHIGIFKQMIGCYLLKRTQQCVH